MSCAVCHASLNTSSSIASPRKISCNEGSNTSIGKTTDDGSSMQKSYCKWLKTIRINMGAVMVVASGTFFWWGIKNGINDRLSKALGHCLNCTVSGLLLRTLN